MRTCSTGWKFEKFQMFFTLCLIGKAIASPVSFSGVQPTVLANSFAMDSTRKSFLSVRVDPVQSLSGNYCFLNLTEHSTNYRHSTGSCLVEDFSDRIASALSLLYWRPPKFWTGQASLPVVVSIIDPLNSDILSTYNFSIPVSVSETQSCTVRWTGTASTTAQSVTPEIPLNSTFSVVSDTSCPMAFSVTVEPSTSGIAKLCDSQKCTVVELVTDEESIIVSFTAAIGFFGTVALTLDVNGKDTISHYLEISSVPQALTLVDLCPAEKSGVFPGCVKVFGCLSLTGGQSDFYFAKLSFPGNISVSQSVSQSFPIMVVDDGLLILAPLFGLQAALGEIKVNGPGDLSVQIWNASNIHDNWDAAFFDDFPLAQLTIPIFQSDRLIPELSIDSLQRAVVLAPNVTSSLPGISIVNINGKESTFALLSLDSLDPRVSLSFMGEAGQHISVNATIANLQKALKSGDFQVTPALGFEGRMAVRLLLSHDDVQGLCEEVVSPKKDDCVCVSPASAGVVCKMKSVTTSHQATVSVLIHK